MSMLYKVIVLCMIPSLRVALMPKRLPNGKPYKYILNISKCSVLELKEELERRGVYDEEDEKIWKKFKDLETKMWVEGYQKEKEDIAKINLEYLYEQDLRYKLAWATWNLNSNITME